MVWLASTLAFFAVHAAPGDIVRVLIGTGPDTPEVRAAVSARWGLDQSLGQQYIEFLRRLLSGDLGESFVLRRPVTDVIGDEILPTVQLAGAASALALLAATAISVATAGRRLRRRVAGSVELTLVSVPDFWLGLMLLFLFSFTLPWFPVAGASGASSLVLPAIALGAPIAGVLSQLMRQGLEEALDQPFATTVRARGVSDLRLRLGHGLRHAALPVVNLGGWIFASLLGGAVIVEQVFGRPGLGRLILSAVQGRDVPLVVGIALMSSIAYVACNTLADLVSWWIDPRLRNPVPA
ncbi:ABC transporter permease [Aeromicrobium alkaliterrae]|uniref:ABC transporter permease n=1 Tax=Aeromicrobium alkaliterrae TaxID=302168 RepID=A0ABN2K8W0_9ACTN